MVFLLQMTVFYYFLTFPLAEAGQFVLDAKPRQLNVLTAESFTLNCTYDVPEEHGQLISLLILKATKDGTKEVVSLQENSDIINHLSPSPDVKFSGRITGKRNGFLFGQWTVVLQGIGGTYTCRANLMDSVGEVTKKHKQVRVVEEKLSFRDAVAAIKESQSHSREILQEVAKITGSAHKSHQEFSQELAKTKQEFSQELAKTKKEFSQELSKIKGFAHSSRKALDAESAKTSQLITWLSRSYKALETATMTRLYAFHRGHEYVAYIPHGNYLINQWDVRAWCRVRGTHLVEIDDDEEWEFLAGVIRRWDPNVKGFYIAGMRDSHNQFKSTRTGQVLKSLRWSPGNPDNSGGNENCLELIRSGSWTVNDINCGHRRAFICKWP